MKTIRWSLGEVIMFTKILVPLDGSELAERALKPAFAIAQKFKSEILLLRIALSEQAAVGLSALAPFSYDFPRAGLSCYEEEAESYLNRIQLCWLNSGVPIYAEVRQGVPAQLIVSAAHEQRADLVVMSTHGRSGFDRLVYGSVAEAVMRGAHVPVLLVPRKAWGQLLRGEEH
jgi:nucleotide-binding universal stress UspA family protein